MFSITATALYIPNTREQGFPISPHFDTFCRLLLTYFSIADWGKVVAFHSIPQMLLIVFSFKINFYQSMIVCNVVLVSAIQQRESVTCIIYLLILIFFSHIDHYRVLGRILGTIQ